MIYQRLKWFPAALFAVDTPANRRWYTYHLYSKKYHKNEHNLIPYEQNLKHHLTHFNTFGVQDEFSHIKMFEKYF